MKNIYSVVQVNSYIKNMFTQDFLLSSLRVKGEVSNCKYHSSGHIYFTLKEKSAVIACVMFAGNRKGLSFQMKEGQQIIVTGSIDVYERDGKYQLYAREIELDGEGALYEKFCLLKNELMEMGMFAPEYKSDIPPFVKRLGIVTASTGAAVRDIINVAKRRNPYIEIMLYPAIVQGEQAVTSIINGIHALEQQNVDVMIVGRGGGSIEDLWAFNERAVAEAIFECSVPVISAVGHETDTTIADYVADLRAPTPSAAAELAVCNIINYMEELEQRKRRITTLMNYKINEQREREKQLQLKLLMLSPIRKVRENRTQSLQLEEKLKESLQRIITGKRHLLLLFIEKMKGLSPLNKLNQGFSYVSDVDGANVSDVSKVIVGQELLIQMKNGEVKSKVVDKTRIRRKI